MNRPDWLHTSEAHAISLRNPAKPSQQVANRSASNLADVQSAVEASTLAQKSWSSMSAADRSLVLYRTGEILLRDEQNIASTITTETGKHIRDSVAEVRNAAGLFKYYAGRAWNAIGQVLPSVREGVSISTLREPVGVIAMISPWNFPVNLLAVKVAPALATGNGVVAKPATIGSGASLMLIDALYEAGLPSGVVNIVLGDGSVVGDDLIRADGINAISFTGSTLVGQRIARAAADLGHRFLGEMGGKNATVVMSDADLEFAVETLISASFSASGQKCTATSRIIVERGIADEFAERFTERTREVHFGDPTDEAMYSGPVVNESQFNTIEAAVKTARGTSSELLTEWGVPSDSSAQGYFIPPTIFNNVAPESDLFREELFGPVVAITTADSLQHAINLTNDSVYGLSASIFTRNLDSATKFTREVEAGVINVNLPTTGLEFQSPYAGYKASGTSFQEQGDEALSFCTAGKTVAIRSGL